MVHTKPGCTVIHPHKSIFSQGMEKIPKKLKQGNKIEQKTKKKLNFPLTNSTFFFLIKKIFQLILKSFLLPFDRLLPL